MKRSPISRLPWLVVGLGLVVGCGDAGQAPVEDEGSKPPNVRDLPRLGELLGPLPDSGLRHAFFAPGAVQELIAPGTRTVLMVASRTLLVEILVVVLGRVEIGELRDGSHDGLIVGSGVA